MTTIIISGLYHQKTDNQAGSHSNKGWESFTSAILRTITSRQSVAGSDKPENGVVLMAWGKHAQNMIAGIDKVSPVLPFIPPHLLFEDARAR